MRLATMQQRVVSLVLALWLATAGAVLLCASQARAQEQPKTEELSRKAKVKVQPVYPDVARRMSIAGTVRLAVIVAPNGTVKSSKPVGGHPLLVSAAMDAMKRWKFEPTTTESAESWNSSLSLNTSAKAERFAPRQAAGQQRAEEIA